MDFIKNSKIKTILLITLNSSGHIKYTSPSSKTISAISSKGWSYNGTFRFSNIMLAEGNDEVAYEPYYILNNTTVTQSSNHTLKAIWEAN